jgi:hypothetical protein
LNNKITQQAGAKAITIDEKALQIGVSLPERNANLVVKKRTFTDIFEKTSTTVTYGCRQNENVL